MVHRLPDDLGLEVTAINFGRSPVNEEIKIAGINTTAMVTDLLTDAPAGKMPRPGKLRLQLAALSGKVLLLK